MNKLYLAGLLLVVVIGVYVGFRKADNGPQGMACTMDAKMCPDGSYVGRTGPDCEFAECPM